MNPVPQQMINLANSELYFTIGVEFESVWLKRFESANPDMKIVDSAAGIERIPALNANNNVEGAVEESTNTGTETDPHIWFSPSRMKQMSQTMAEAMQAADPQNADFYQTNLEALLIKIDAVDAEVRTQLQGSKRDHFMVVHLPGGMWRRSMDCICWQSKLAVTNRLLRHCRRLSS